MNEKQNMGLGCMYFYMVFVSIWRGWFVLILLSVCFNEAAGRLFKKKSIQIILVMGENEFFCVGYVFKRDYLSPH